VSTRGEHERILVCSFGNPRIPYDEVTYGHDGKTYTTKFAPSAVARLLGGFNRVLVLATPTVIDARAQPYRLDAMLSELHPIAADAVPVPEPEESGSAGETVEALLMALEKVPRESELVVDLTLAFRSLPFLYFAAVACGRELYGHKVSGVLYAARDVQGDIKPLVDVSEALELYEWFFALRRLHEDADPRPLGRLVPATALRRRAPDGLLHAKSLARHLQNLAGPMQEVLLVDEAFIASRIDEHQVEGIASSHAIGRRLDGELRALVGAAKPPAGTFPSASKSSAVLTRAWLEHQLDRVRFHAEHGRVGAALRALREWLISRVILARGERGWLERDVRQTAERALTNDYQAKGKIGFLYNDIVTLRNRLSHAGMTTERVDVPELAKVIALIDRCRELIAEDNDGLLSALPTTAPADDGGGV
jgi:hypothetical protein